MSDAEPRGELVLRTLAMPADTNANGDIFGGWIMSQMDIAGGILAKEVADGRTVTVAVDGMKFLHPCLLYTSPSPRDQRGSRMPSSA